MPATTAGHPPNAANVGGFSLAWALLFALGMGDAEFRQTNHADHDAGSHTGQGGGGAVGKRTRTSSLPARKGEAAKFAAEKIEHGLHDENKLTNEVFWWLEPELPREKLKAGSEEAAEWLQVRNEIVRPALSGKEHHDGEVGGHELHQAVPNARTDPAPPSGDPDLDKLLAEAPPNGSPNQAEAAWLLRALKAGFIEDKGRAKAQLEQIAQGKTAIRTSEGEPGAYQLKRGLAYLEKNNVHVERIQSGVYEVDAGHLPILGPMVDLTAGRIREWLRGGKKGKKHAFWFGDLVRADAGYANEKGGTRHTTGNAVDVGGLDFNNASEVVTVLSALEAHKIAMVFPDGGADGITPHIHLALTDGGQYELGIPFSSAFFAHAHHLGNAIAAAEKEAGGKAAPDGTTRTVHGVKMWETPWYEATGVVQGGAWRWSKKAVSGDSARNHIQSGAMKALLGKLHSGSSAKISKVALAEDGGKVKDDADHG